MVIVYRQKLVELEQLKELIGRLEEAIRVNANYYINEQNQIKRDIGKE